jgi:hypothetical protein
LSAYAIVEFVASVLGRQCKHVELMLSLQELAFPIS